MLVVCSPVLDQGDINGTPRTPRSEVEGPRCPQESNAIGRVVCVEWGLLEEGLHILRKLKLLIVIRQRLLTLRRGIKNKCIKVELTCKNKPIVNEGGLHS